MAEKKNVKTFVVERRYYNPALRVSEIERIIVLGEEIRGLTNDDVLKGINFNFVPLEEMILPGSNIPCPEFHRRILRINFEVALAELRRYAMRERDMYFRTPLAAPVQLNHSLVRMFVPPDLHHPSIEWNMVSEPEGHVYRVPPQGHMSQIIHAQHQDAVSKVISGAYYPNNALNMPSQRSTVDRVMNCMVEERNRQLSQATRYPLGLPALGLDPPPPPAQKRGRPRARRGERPYLPLLPFPAPSTLVSSQRQGEPTSTSGVTGVSRVPAINIIPTTVAEASVTTLSPIRLRILAPASSPEVMTASRRPGPSNPEEEEEEAEDLSPKRRRSGDEDWSPSHSI